MTRPLNDAQLREIEAGRCRFGCVAADHAADLIAEIRRLREQHDHLVSAFDKLSDQMGEFLRAARSERDRLTAEVGRLRGELTDAAGYLAATHRHANRHDVLGVDLGCAGCALLERIEDGPQSHAEHPSSPPAATEPSGPGTEPQRLAQGGGTFPLRTDPGYGHHPACPFHPDRAGIFATSLGGLCRECWAVRYPPAATRREQHPEGGLG